jgi:hypothetical protein
MSAFSEGYQRKDSQDDEKHIAMGARIAVRNPRIQSSASPMSGVKRRTIPRAKEMLPNTWKEANGFLLGKIMSTSALRWS